MFLIANKLLQFLSSASKSLARAGISIGDSLTGLMSIKKISIYKYFYVPLFFIDPEGNKKVVKIDFELFFLNNFNFNLGDVKGEAIVGLVKNYLNYCIKNFIGGSTFQKYEFYLILPEIFLLLLICLFIMYVSYFNFRPKRDLYFFKFFLSFVIISLYQVIKILNLFKEEIYAYTDYKNFPIENMVNEFDFSAVIEVLKKEWVQNGVMGSNASFYNDPNFTFPLGNFFEVNVGIIYMKLLILFLYIFILFIFFFNILKYKYITVENRDFIFNFIIISLIGVFSIFCLISASDLMSFFISIEALSLCLYILIGLRQNISISVEASMKYFLNGSIYSCLLGVSLWFIYAGSGCNSSFKDINKSIQLLFISENNFWDYSVYNTSQVLLFIGFILFIISFMVKLAGFPFNFWIGDVYQGAPFISTMFLMVVPRFGLFLIFIKIILQIFFDFFVYSFYINQIFLFMGIISIVAGGFFTYKQTEIKRLFAYSSITHTGFIFVALSKPTLLSVNISLYYLFIYLLTTILILSFLYLNPVKQIGLAIKKNKTLLYGNFGIAKTLGDLKSLPFYKKIFFSILLFSSAGIPPLPGFLIKFNVYYCFFNHYLSELFHVKNLYIVFLFLLFIFSGFISAYAYIRLVFISLFEIKNIANFSNYVKVIKENTIKIKELKEYYYRPNIIFNSLIFIVFFSGIFFITFYYNKYILNPNVQSKFIMMSHSLQLSELNYNTKIFLNVHHYRQLDFLNQFISFNEYILKNNKQYWDLNIEVVKKYQQNLGIISNYISKYDYEVYLKRVGTWGIYK